MIALLATLQVGIIAGGSTPVENYNSHRVHVEALLAELGVRELPPARVTVFWADGRDPAVDRAVRLDDAPEGDWLIRGTLLDEPTEPGPTLHDTRFEGWDVRPARANAIRAWLAEIGPQMGPGDTLLLAVTDHGEPDPDGGSNTAISLWHERLTVVELGEALRLVPATVRVVLWMSQCHSGGFAALYETRPNLCGLFSAAADRVAYGCFPELADRPEVGHFRRVLGALSALEPSRATVAGISDRVMHTDDTPDTPHLTSDLLLSWSLLEISELEGVEIREIVDGALRELPPDAPERVQAASIAQRYALGPVHTFGAIDRLLERLDAARYELDTWSERWRGALDAARQRLISHHAGAVPVPGEGSTRAERMAARHKLARLARRDLRTRRGLAGRLEAMRRRLSRADDLSRRLELQEAAALRVGTLQVRAAGPRLLSSEDRAALERLRRCEGEPLLPIPSSVSREPLLATTEVLGPAAELLPVVDPVVGLIGAISALRPSFFGVRYRNVKGPPAGAVEIEQVLAGTPAARAGLLAGDVIVAAGGVPLSEPSQFREAALVAPSSQPLRLRLRRAGVEREVTIRPAAMALPVRPPLVGELVPPLPLLAYDEALPELGEGPLLLFFWATWCKPCKRALPALGAWAARRGVRVLAVTDEPRAKVKAFLKAFGPFPHPIGLDPSGEVARIFQVSTTPVFILIGGDGIFLDEGEGFTGTIPLE